MSGRLRSLALDGRFVRFAPRVRERGEGVDRAGRRNRATSPPPWLADRALPFAIGINVGLAVISLPLARVARRRLPQPLADGLVSAGLMVGGWVAIRSVEQVAPFREDWVEPHDDVAADLAYLTCIGPFTAAAARTGAIVVGAVFTRVGGRRHTWSDAVPLPARVGAALLVTELVHYWHHRLAHEIPTLRRFHKTHHSSERVYWMNAVRFHPVDEAPLLFLQTVVLDLIGVDRDALVVHNVLKVLNGFVQHANISGSCGPLNLVFSTGEQHRLHHAARTGPSSNFGAVLSLWDRVFGTQEDPPAEPFTERVGLADPVGYPTDAIHQMIEPFTAGTYPAP